MQISTFILINGILNETEDLELRIHTRSQLETAKIKEVIEKCRTFGLPNLDKQVEIFDRIEREDRERIMQHFDQNVLTDLSDPQDVYLALLRSMEGSDARKYFLSALQHLLLIREDGEVRTRYYQLIDKLVTTIVLDKKPNFDGGLQGLIGVSVARLVAQFNETDRAQIMEDEAGEARSQVLQLQLELENLQREVNLGADGLVGDLKQKLATSEAKVDSLRRTVQILQDKVDSQKNDNEGIIFQLERQISELFRMLREGSSLAEVVDSSSGMDRRQLVDKLEKQYQRKRTVVILEGKSKRLPSRPSDKYADGSGEEEGDTTADLSRDSTRARIGRKSKSTRSGGNGRTSQFMDAEDESVQEQMDNSFSENGSVSISTDPGVYFIHLFGNVVTFPSSRVPQCKR